MIRGEATATLKDGRTLTLAMGFRALALAAAETSIPSADIFAVLRQDDGRQMLVMLALIGGSLNKYHREIGPDELDGLMATDSQVLSDALSQAMLGAFSDEPTGEPEGNGQAGTSTPSKKAGRKRV